MLSIIIPYYKLTFFEYTLKSLAAQTCQDFKVYIGDDASPEDPSKLLEKYKGKFDFEYYRFETNLGNVSLTQQWERCIALSDTEPWLMIFGDDDVLGEKAVEEFYKNLEEIETIGCNVVRFATQKINEFGICISDIYIHPKIENALDFLFRKTRSSLSEYVFKKEKVLEIGFKDFPFGWFSDVLAVLEFSDFGKIWSLNTMLIYIRVSNKSISGNRNLERYKKEAGFNFSTYLLLNFSEKFNIVQKDYILRRAHLSFLDNKSNISFFIRITLLHLKKMWILDYLKFLYNIFKRFAKSI